MSNLPILFADGLGWETMASVFEKLNLKDRQEMVVLNAPASEPAATSGLTARRNISDNAYSTPFGSRPPANSARIGNLLLTVAFVAAFCSGTSDHRRYLI